MAGILVEVTTRSNSGFRKQTIVTQVLFSECKYNEYLCSMLNKRIVLHKNNAFLYSTVHFLHKIEYLLLYLISSSHSVFTTLATFTLAAFSN